MPLDALITGRIATLEGDRGSAGSRRSGSGTVGSRSQAPRCTSRPGPTRSRNASASSRIRSRSSRADRRPPAPGTSRAGVAPCRPRRSPTLEDGLVRLREAHERLPADAWLEGHGWDSDRWRLADCRRAGSGRAGSEGHLGTRPSRTVGQPRGGPRGGAVRWRPAGRRHPAGRRPDARRRAVRGGHPAHHDPRSAAVGRRPRARDHRGRAGPGLARRRCVP